MDRAFLEELLSILESRDPVTVREHIEKLMELPPEAVQAMKQTPIGDVPRIDIG
jgi:L-lysine 2,3-aminomutase